MSEPLVPGPAFELLFEHPALPAGALPAELARAYGGGLGFEGPRLFANFVASLDGVVALNSGGNSGQVISQDSRADRFVMGLLRACAGAVIVGAGTFRKSATHRWQPEVIYPPAAALYAELRAKLGLALSLQLVLVSESGELVLDAPALSDAWVATSPEGADRLRGKLPSGARLMAFDFARSGLSDLVSTLHDEGHQQLLTEGGPTLFARLVRERLVDELFLTSAPTLFGRFDDDRRKSLLQGLDLAGTTLELSSVRRNASHLFLRYALNR
ncbi:MAG: dihydrofolate reductase family protein [Polyangiaceae bacterium]